MAGADYPGTYQELLAWFPDNRACLEYLERLRWPDGFVCPRCGAGACWRTGKGLLMCAACGRQTSVTAGTIFHRTRTPLATWFAAIWFVTSQKNGVSALGLQRVLGFGSYETAWAWLHKLRRAMVRPDRDRLSGTVEVDEVMVGGVDVGTAGAGGDKVPVMVAVERSEGQRLGRMRAQIAAAPGTLQLVTFAAGVVEPGSTIHTDGARGLRRLADMGYTHHDTTGYDAADKSAVLPGVHLIASLLKRWIAGTLHHRVSTEQLPYYLHEYIFRFNRRTAHKRGLLFYRLLQQAVATDPHPLHDLQRLGDAGW
ncbi:IS1595 family transposase [Jiangella ureilytica]|uniref:IS1595 family transposase n=1 Tax=Jiangella ureilytica TaxID=2530374 RepID=UPI001EF0D871|nr:IS1595 family transposase [Jiangella ureilytica]